jgi:hypothetical protein
MASVIWERCGLVGEDLRVGVGLGDGVLLCSAELGIPRPQWSRSCCQWRRSGGETSTAAIALSADA